MPRISKERIDVAVNKWAKSVVRKARANLTREKANSSRSLWSSIRYKYKNGVIVFTMDDYGAFLDKGVSGTGKLPLSATKTMPVPYNKSEAEPEYFFKDTKKTIGGNLKGWLQKKGLDPSLDFIIRRSIHAKGIRPRRFFTNAFNESIPELDVIIDEAAELMIEDTFTEIQNKFNT